MVIFEELDVSVGELDLSVGGEAMGPSLRTLLRIFEFLQNCC